MAKVQKSRKPKTSNGTAIGSKPTRLNEIQKVLLGHGMVHKPRPKKK